MNKNFKINIRGRDFVIGDLHGCYDSLIKTMEDISFDKEKDRMFSVGDLIDRGKQNMECLRLVKEPWFHSVLGNHEDVMFGVIFRNSHKDMWKRNGGEWWFDKPKDVDPDELIDICQFADKKIPWGMSVETSFGKVGICHAQPPKDWNDFDGRVGDHFKEHIAYARTKIMHRDSDWHVKNVDYTIHGHTPVCTPVSVGNSLYIDTGICFNGVEDHRGKTMSGYLTCIELDNIPQIVKDVSWPKIKKQLKKEQRELFD